MPNVAQFEAAAREAGDEDPITFTLGDEEFVVRDAITVLDVRRVQRDEQATGAPIEAVLDIFRKRVVGDEAYGRFEQALDDCGLTMVELSELFNKIMEAQAARPTRRSRASASGRATTSPSSSERASKLASLGLVEADELTGSAV